MFEKSLIDFLEADADIVALLGTFESRPAIFSNMAPQRAVAPYAVFDIDKAAVENLGVSSFDVVIDLYDKKESAADLRQLATLIEYRCDRAVLPETDARFGQIRLFYEDGREVENSDIEIRHYVLRLSARAGRKAWMAQI